jgi:hypothetical protein
MHQLCKDYLELQRILLMGSSYLGTVDCIHMLV